MDGGRWTVEKSQLGKFLAGDFFTDYPLQIISQRQLSFFETDLFLVGHQGGMEKARNVFVIFCFKYPK